MAEHLTEASWISLQLLTDDYNTYVCAHALTVLAGSEHWGAHPGICLFNPGLNYFLLGAIAISNHMAE